MRRLVCLSISLTYVLMIGASARGAESLWIEAEHLDGIRGYCWPMGRPEMKQTDGHWGLSGPGWAAEWNQGGESGFLSIATGADDDRAVAGKMIEIPVDGHYFVWVRYGDWREQTERFQIRLEQEGAAPWTGHFGEQAAIDEDNEMKLYWGWAFAWDGDSVDLKKGPARLSLLSITKEPQPRQIDAIVLSTDPAYRPRIKDRPRSAACDVLAEYRQGIPADLEPLARRLGDFNLPEPWKVKTFQDRGFRYLWNVSDSGDTGDWLSDDPARVLYPYSVRDEATIAAFKKKYSGQTDVPIFADSRIVPTFHGVGPVVFRTDAATGAVQEPGQRFARWLDEHPDRLWGTMMNYAADTPIGEQGIAQFQKYRDRYVGAISGESLGYYYPDPAEMKTATAEATKRRQLAEAFNRICQASNAAKYRTVFGRDLDANPYQDVISCMSVGNIVFAPLLSEWGTRTIGYESAAATSTILGMRWAFIRGTARQGDHLTATYRSCNFGDSATMFSNAGNYSSPQNILDNYYSVFSGAGVTWYKMDIWYQYMAGSSMFYHEQGFDEFWLPGGTTAAGIRDVELSPKGKLVDRFLRTTAEQPDRGHPFTPVAFLVDYAHGWEPSPYWPNSFKNFHENPDSFRPGDHERMLQEYFWSAYYPIGPESERPITGTNEVFLPGVYGDMFDCVVAYPDVERWTTIDTYPVVVANGEIELTEAEGQRLAQYVNAGGTLLVADAHLTGPGVAALGLPPLGETAEADSYRWMSDDALHPSPRFRYRPITGRRLPMIGRALATTESGDVFCAAFDRGQGRLIYLSVPHGLSIGKQVVPAVPRLLAHLTRGLMPIEVDGDVQWLVNRTSRGWAVTLLNPAGQDKPQQGIVATDYRQNRPVTIRARVPITVARDRLLLTDPLTVEDGAVSLEVLAGSVRIIELE
jgi:hypothetical protein